MVMDRFTHDCGNRWDLLPVPRSIRCGCCSDTERGISPTRLIKVRMLLFMSCSGLDWMRVSQAGGIRR